MTFDGPLAALATLYADIGRQVKVHGKLADAAAAISETAVQRVPGCEQASITAGREGSFRTIAYTGPAALAVDEIQYELGTGPCVDAILEETVFRTGDLGADARWPEMGRRAAETNGVQSMLSIRLFLEDDDLIAGLNLYSTAPDAFDDASETVGTLLATHGALALAAANAREEAAHLRHAVMSNREIGVAMGILMNRYKITRDEAFDLLRIASQGTNRKLAAIAAEVGDTGVLDLPDRSGAARRTSTPKTPRRSPRPVSEAGSDRKGPGQAPASF